MNTSTTNVRFARDAGFLGLPAIAPDELKEYEDRADALLLGLPFDGGTTSLPGQRHGPELLRALGPSVGWTVDPGGRLSGMFDPVARRDVLQGRVIFDVGDLGPVPIDPSLTRSAYYDSALSAAFQLKAYCDVPIFLGGDHSLTGALLAGVHKFQGEPLALVCLDAHCDYETWPATRPGGRPLTHANFLNDALESGCIHSAEIYGVRALLPGSADALPTALTCFRDFSEASLSGQRAPTYLSIDVDVLDPSVLKGTGHPEEDGLSLRDLKESISSIIRYRNVVAIDIVEPTYDRTSNDDTARILSSILLTCLRNLFDAKE